MRQNLFSPTQDEMKPTVLEENRIIIHEDRRVKEAKESRNKQLKDESCSFRTYNLKELATVI